MNDRLRYVVTSSMYGSLYRWSATPGAGRAQRLLRLPAAAGEVSISSRQAPGRGQRAVASRGLSCSSLTAGPSCPSFPRYLGQWGLVDREEAWVDPQVLA